VAVGAGDGVGVIGGVTLGETDGVGVGSASELESRATAPPRIPEIARSHAANKVTLLIFIFAPLQAGSFYD